MAGRILPVALATISGIAIGMATFGEEFKEQQKRRLQDEYDRDVASASALPSNGPSPMASSSIPAPQAEQLPAQMDALNTSTVSSMLGLWAWSSKEKHGHATKEQATAPTSTEKHDNNP